MSRAGEFLLPCSYRSSLVVAPCAGVLHAAFQLDIGNPPMSWELVADVHIHPSLASGSHHWRFWCYRFTASNNALWDLDFANGTHTVKEFPQLWWRKYRNFKLAETENLYLFDNPELCFSAHLSFISIVHPCSAFL